jgi:hypothetical protein
LSGSIRSGGASTSVFVIGPPTGNVAFCHCVSSICSTPRCTSAVPRDITISLSFLSGSAFTAARLLGRNCAVESSTLTAALDSGELQFGVARSTDPVLMRTATLVGRLVPMEFSSTVISVSAFTV